MKISLNMSMSKIKMDLCAIKQKLLKTLLQILFTMFCLEIKGKQTVKLRSGSIKFKKYFK